MSLLSFGLEIHVTLLEVALFFSQGLCVVLSFLDAVTFLDVLLLQWLVDFISLLFSLSYSFIYFGFSVSGIMFNCRNAL